MDINKSKELLKQYKPLKNNFKSYWTKNQLIQHTLLL